jgi:hypothetical protein
MRIDWFKVFFVLVVGFLFAIVECSYLLFWFRYNPVVNSNTILGTVWAILTFTNAFLFYRIISVIESKFKLN